MALVVKHLVILLVVNTSIRCQAVVAAEGREKFWAFLKGEGCLAVEGGTRYSSHGMLGREDPISMDRQKVGAGL
jgi:hypothetical protein